MRVGIIGITINGPEQVEKVNRVLSENSEIIIGRMGIPYSGGNLRMISLFVKGNTDVIGGMAGKIGSLKGVQIKSMLMKDSGEPVEGQGGKND